MSFKVGDRVVYPHHGAAINREEGDHGGRGEKREYLILKIGTAR